MTPAIQGRRIAIMGASGQLGRPTIAALLARGVHTITAIQRPDAPSSFPTGVIVKRGALDDEAFLADVLKDQDVLVLMPPLSHIVELQEPAIRAAATVGLPYIFPSEFGPDPFAGKLVEENGLLVAKKRVRDLIESLGVSSWVSVVVGPWLDAGLQAGLWGIDAKSRKATVWRGAEGRASMATVAHTAQALAATLSLPEAELAGYRNRGVYTPSFHLTQRELLGAVQRATGTTDTDWDVQVRRVEDLAKEYEEDISRGDGTAPFVKFFVTHFLEGHGGDFEAKVDNAALARLGKLGLEQEDLDSAIRAALQ